MNRWNNTKKLVWQKRTYLEHAESRITRFNKPKHVPLCDFYLTFRKRQLSALYVSSLLRPFCTFVNLTPYGHMFKLADDGPLKFLFWNAPCVFFFIVIHTKFNLLIVMYCQFFCALSISFLMIIKVITSREYLPYHLINFERKFYNFFLKM